jgi:hypothetical protein
LWVKKIRRPVAARFSASGTFLAVVTWGPGNVLAPGYELVLFRTATGEEVWRKSIEADRGSFCGGIAFVGSHHVFVSMSKAGPSLRAYRTASGEPVELSLELDSGNYNLTAASEAPTLLAYRGEQYHVLRVDSQGGIEHLSRGVAKDIYHSRHYFEGGAVSPDGQRILLATRAECRVYPADGDQPLATIAVRGDVAPGDDGRPADASSGSARQLPR